jgi:1-acyl-sn-glycerol-3-phosphate acyltransferase
MTDSRTEAAIGRHHPVRAARSLLFCVSYLTHSLLVMGPVQALVLAPWARLSRDRGRRVLAAWQRGQGRFVFALARWIAGVDLRIDGRIPPGSAIVVMNHQSLLDIPLAFVVVEKPSPLIPARERYVKVPVFGHLLRLAGHPVVRQRGNGGADERAELTRALESVARGEHSLLIFPEGHRSPEGTLRPFMTGGLRLAFQHAPHHPVYLALVQGFAHVRTFADLALRIAGTRARVTVLGPFAIPTDPATHADFIASLRERLLETLAAQRRAAGEPETHVAG